LSARNTFIFQTCISRCKLDVPEPNQRPYATLEMTSNNWGRINEAKTRPGMGTGDKFANWNMGVSINGGTPK
jgi:hypothetical protein